MTTIVTGKICEFDAKYGITIDVALLAVASALLFVKTLTETLPSSLAVLSTVAILGLLVHILVREFVPSYCPIPAAQTSVPLAPTTTTSSTPPPPTKPPAAAAAQKPPVGSALEFWKDTPGLQGRQLAAPRCARGYSNYIPVPEPK